MAIVVEEERASSGGIITFMMWAVILGVIVSAVYYIFFKKPDIIPNLVTPANFKNTQRLSQIKLPSDVLDQPAFKSLQQYVTPVFSPNVGKNDPFAPF